MQQVTNKETEILLELLQECCLAAGEVVEMGCYKGDTSVLLQKCLLKLAAQKKLYLYDSFAGLPEKSAEDNSVAGDQFRAGELFVTKREVINKFKRANLPVPIIKKGFFEELDATTDVPAEICFAFLDGDLYKSIQTSLRLVFLKMQPGGMIVVHDYNNPELPGVTRAVEEFLAEKGGIKMQVRESLAIMKFETN